jgi:hypothetical protein
LALQGTVSTGNGFFTNIPVVLTTATTLSQSGTGTFAAPISGGGSLEIASGAVLMTASNPYVGATTIDPGATLALSGAGSIAASAGVATNGTFDISGATSGASITTLSGSGAVNLGSRTLTLTNASGTFGGALADGGLGGGIGGGLTVAAGTQTLNGQHIYRPDDDQCRRGAFACRRRQHRALLRRGGERHSRCFRDHVRRIHHVAVGRGSR